MNILRTLKILLNKGIKNDAGVFKIYLLTFSKMYLCRSETCARLLTRHFSNRNCNKHKPVNKQQYSLLTDDI